MFVGLAKWVACLIVFGVGDLFVSRSGLLFELIFVLFSELSVLWVVFCCVSLLVLIEDLLFLTLYFNLYLLSSFFLFLEIFGRQVFHTLLSVLLLPFLLHLFLFLNLLQLLIIFLDILGWFDTGIFDYLLTPLLFLWLSLHVSALDIYLGVDGRMVTD